MVGDEIKQLMDVGDLTVADISHWLDEPRSTVVGWIEGATPVYQKRSDIWIKLGRLRKIVARSRKTGFVPSYIRQRERKAYIIKIRDTV